MGSLVDKLRSKIEHNDAELYKRARILTRGAIHDYSSFRRWKDRLVTRLISLIVTQATMKTVVIKLTLQIQNGSAIGAALQGMEKSHSRHLGSYHPISLMLGVMIQRYAERSSLSYAFAPFLDKTILAIIQAGESVTGGPIRSLNLALETYGRRNQIKTKVKVGLAMPMAVFSAGVGTVVYCHYEIFPQFARAMTDEQSKGLMGEMIRNTAAFVGALPLLGVVVIALLIYIKWSIPNQIGRRPNNIPPWSIFNAADSAITLLVLSSLLESGAKTIAALKTIEKNSSRYNAYWIRRIRIDAGSGTELGKAIACGYFNRQARIDIECYAGNKEFALLLKNLSLEVFDGTVAYIDKLVKVIGLGAMITVALYIMTISMAMMM
ncbi:hypothetical protein [Vibrio navarrensis]|uniref:hypothetical protein n=1 Tax=Vibrio navarrensis TaxID=29495 RepID=UPI0018DC6FB5|nr:hypothetical protein [Vibrio navarrensis]MBH9740040.1 hypothetical protein [Vibrio navarrensis]